MKVTEINMSMAEIIAAIRQMCATGKEKVDAQACDCEICHQTLQHMIVTSSNGKARVKVSVV